MASNGNLYYALVWNTTLKIKNKTVEGELLNKNTILPDDPRMLYGTNPNDILKIQSESFVKIMKYDVMTMTQSVKFHKKIEEVIIPRDVRIIVWENSELLNLSEDNYRIVTPEYFKEIINQLDKESDVKLQPESEDNHVLYKYNKNKNMSKSLFGASCLNDIAVV